MSKTEVEQYEFEEVSSKPKIKSAIEALLFVSGEPLTIKDLSNSIEVSPKTISNILNEMILDYEEEKRGIKLISINGEYQLVTKAENSDYIQKLLSECKLEAVVTFLALLELIKLRMIKAYQNDNFDDILIERRKIGE